MENSENYHKEIYVKASPKQVFEAITKHIDKWWSENYEGEASEIDDEFTVRFGETFKTMEITYIEENSKVSWLCVDQHIEAPPGIAPFKNKREWVGNTILWEIEADGENSILKHTHLGLTPQVECWGVCETGWDQTLKSLSEFIEMGKGMPFEQLDQEHLSRALEHQKNKLERES